MKANELCPSKHLSADDLEGKDKIVTIKSVTKDVVGAEKVTKGILLFQEFDRGMVVNKTNKDRIVALYGNDCDAWIGKKIALYPSETDSSKGVVPCIRVRPKVVE